MGIPVGMARTTEKPATEKPAQVVREAARGRAEHTPWTLHTLVALAIGAVFAVVTAIALSLYLFL